MAQRKAPASGKTSPGKATPSKSASGKPSGARTGTRPSAARTAATRPPAKKKGKSIVNQRQTPWGMIIAAVAVVIFAAGVVVAVVVTQKGGSSSTPKNGTGSGSAHTVNANDPYRQPELAAAKKIQGVTYRVEGQHEHVNGVIKYDASPPIGGDHSQYWANCNGVVYDHQIANENAVHMLEHGAVWITYNPKTLPAADVTKLKSYVTGQSRVAMSPYAGLKTPISMQAWGYQLFLTSASDPRIAQFISTLEYNPKTTPEPGAGCTDPYWTAAAAKSSTLGHPFDG